MKKINKGIMSSNSYEWETPQKVYDFYNERFCFDGDVCASKSNHKHPVNYFTKSDDGLNQDWWHNNWMNPPYGSEIIKWVKKAYEESLNDKLVVCLLPARTDTKWWQDYVMRADSIHFIRGRLKFNGKGSAPFPSAVVVFGLHYSN